MFKSIKNLSINDIPNYDIYVSILESAISRISKLKDKSKYKYDWEDNLKKDYQKYLNSTIDKKNLFKIAFLIKGYSFNSKNFLSLFP